ncbi:hypothetical protein RYX36_004422, partial [Vicia faba]
AFTTVYESIAMTKPRKPNDESPSKGNAPPSPPRQQPPPRLPLQGMRRARLLLVLQHVIMIVRWLYFLFRNHLSSQRDSHE